MIKTGKDNKRLREYTWDDYGISKGRYRELLGFCSQYRQKKKDAKRLSDYALAVAAGSGEGALRYYQNAKRAVRDCRMIEEAAMWAANASGYKQAWKAILRNVADGIGYDNLRGYDLPFSSPDFYGARRAFFHRLNQLQIAIDPDEK